MVRPVGAAAETWHRDESPTARDDDLIFGGWINMDNHPQIFSCNAGSHKGLVGNGGFEKVVDKGEIEACNQRRVHVVVPPGFILMFNQNILHEVVADKHSYASYRLFTSWRITKSSAPLIPTILDELGGQKVVTLKSGQVPPMWAKLHWTNWVDKLETYSESFHPSCLEKEGVKSGKNKGREVTRVQRHLRGLVEYGFELYPGYTARELRLHTPH